MADFTFAHREEGFDQHIEQSIRGYSYLIDDVISLSRHFVEDNTKVYDMANLPRSWGWLKSISGPFATILLGFILGISP